MKTLPVEQETYVGETLVEKKTVNFGIMPPHRDACQICGHKPAHGPDEPHNAQSLYYQYAFKGEHGRWPTWKDAIAHCPPEIQAKWERELKRMKQWSEPQPENAVS
jgi:hypothetical protein